MPQHKLTFILMTGSLLSGIALAIGHHLFYEHLNDRIVQSQNQQEWFLRIGTGIAFLVGALLSAAIGIAYIQILWRTLRSKSVTINGIDSLFGVSHNAWDLTTLELWTAAPALTIVAVIAWALPLIAVITPATLSIEISSQPNITVIESLIPHIDYDKSLWFGGWKSNTTVMHTAHISRLLLPVATLGFILNIPAPFPNSSYSVDFYGPSISCDTPDNRSFTDNVSKIIEDYSKLYGNVTYVGFVPTDSIYYTTPESSYGRTWEEYAIEGLHAALNSTRVDGAASLDITAYEMFRYQGKTDPASFYVVTPNRLSWRAENTIKCQLYNSSYSINFTFDNGLQDIKYKIEKLNGVTIRDGDECRFGRQLHRCNPVTAYLSLMNAMGGLLLGARWHTGNNAYGVQRTMIWSTTLDDLPDMHSFHREKPKSPIKEMSMADTLEELFTNVTISIFSDSQFLQNDTAASYGPITRFSAQNAFSYEPRNLFIAYGIGILFSMIIVIYGLLCIKSASASYANSFSTILRTTRNPDLDTVIPTAETSGAEPLSKNIGNIRLMLRRQGSGLEGDGEISTFFAVDPKSENGKGTREATPTESLLKQKTGSQHSDTDEISNTQEGPDVNLHHKTDNHAAVTCND
ncbi:hypothetical protein FVEN_g132 [Fusarium venenatum]|uniref:Uncharacterized protein n=1 Tax=Fusarium venenatum TaxID=56646 RepID=A0A2L2TFY6_9HYPO|nr:uncharacterized protein FVRRES_07773 [Fusarium venenatum]KAG8361809.1 hypothetical protein FVEN_g132 [Fusarium venenatum]CEI63337.1 unnamed protein product [Fusarium venenatum]